MAGVRRIALTGGIACGKSLVSRFLNEAGVLTIDADDVVHRLIPDPAERRRLAKEVFADVEARRALEARLHPLVKREIDDFLDTATRAGRTAIAVVPLLFEAHWDRNYDIICAVVSTRAAQVARLMTTRHHTREEAEARIHAQLPVGEKAARANYVITNEGSVDELRLKTKAFVSWLQQSEK